MKKTNVLISLAWFVALTTAIYAGLGLFWPGSGSPHNFTTLHGQIVQINARGIYQFDPVFQLQAGIRFSPGQFVGLIGSWVIMGAFAVGLLAAFFNNFNEKGN